LVLDNADTGHSRAVATPTSADREGRPVARADKVTAVAELTERFQSSSGAVLTEYRGLSVSQLGELRKLLAADATYSVVKNTITKIAANEAGVTPELTKLLTGPSAIAFVQGDVVAAAKGLRDFARANPLLVIKGGVLDGKPLTPAEIVRLADLESREVLLAKLAGAMKASLANAAGTFAALPVQMAQLLGALEAKRAAEGPPTEAAEAPAAEAAEAPAAEVPAADAPAAEVPAAEAPATEAATAEGTATDTTSDAAEAAAADGSES
jgi:large subunit ribosomal protein L10